MHLYKRKPNINCYLHSLLTIGHIVAHIHKHTDFYFYYLFQKRMFERKKNGKKMEKNV